MRSSGCGTLAGRMHGYFGNTRETAAVRAHITLIEHELAPRPSFDSLMSQAEAVSTPLERLIEDSGRRATAEMVLEMIGIVSYAGDMRVGTRARAGLARGGSCRTSAPTISRALEPLQLKWAQGEAAGWA